ncbi:MULTISPECIES: aldo/keto reductase [unclassified Rhodococcus (in: high G+C Gram-positive bacteria)]|uniref:aldo/keto reductase n=1 Tax=unclassified Rhodococcus (in: high G+C Gram-positive bacteria) TaxID=192944 RepID=UPI00215D5ADB|nr:MULTISPECIES: aldo/keto reductase [unclassified Rhodococcus (in: high G+C Gram-positive bacteria)]
MDDEAIRTIHRALDLGVTHIDTAEVYGTFGSETIVGRDRRTPRRRGDRDEVRSRIPLGPAEPRSGPPPDKYSHCSRRIPRPACTADPRYTPRAPRQGNTAADSIELTTEQLCASMPSRWRPAHATTTRT